MSTDADTQETTTNVFGGYKNAHRQFSARTALLGLTAASVRRWFLRPDQGRGKRKAGKEHQG